MRAVAYLAFPRLQLFLLLFSSFVCLAQQFPPTNGHLESPALSRQQEICAPATINYITHVLPQQCLGVISSKPTGDELASQTPTTDQSTHTSTDATGGDGINPDAAPRSILSFEDWKERVPRHVGQEPPSAHTRRRPTARDGSSAGEVDTAMDSLGDDIELSLNLDDTYTEQDKQVQQEIDAVRTRRDEGTEAPDSQASGAFLYDDGQTRYYRSKDAGKTCKERFSYSSFDAGATVLKTGRGSKNAKAILVENKDTYMLLECAEENKYVIIELSDDILVDTVVLANFEFFSSMIRHFRVSVSDRYPAKLDKWRDLGTFEAKNSRDIQSFLVENPQIWAKYVRIEFLTHFGNEYYCPLSLVRVHGTRMLESWQEVDGSREDDEDEDDHARHEGKEEHHEREGGQHEAGDPHSSIRPPDNDTEGNNLSQMDGTEHSSGPDILSPPSYLSPDDGIHIDYTAESLWLPDSALRIRQPSDVGTCPTPAPAFRFGASSDSSWGSAADSLHTIYTYDDGSNGGTLPESSIQTPEPPTSILAASSSSNSTSVPSSSARQGSKSNTATLSNPIQSDDGGNQDASHAQTRNQSGQASAPPKSKSSATAGGPSASPTVQESFFKSINKRLQLLESNMTLSLKYLEDQSRHLNDVLQSAEKRQLSRVDSFIQEMNRTLLGELGSLRQQYDEIWQFAAMALDSQRDQSEREIMALSSRLNLLADEVIFQKRMAITQAVLLLTCLVLVIFTRGNAIPQAPIPLVLQRARSAHNRSPLDNRTPSRAFSTQSRFWTSVNDGDYSPEPPPYPVSLSRSECLGHGDGLQMGIHDSGANQLSLGRRPPDFPQSPVEDTGLDRSPSESPEPSQWASPSLLPSPDQENRSKYRPHQGDL